MNTNTANTVNPSGVIVNDRDMTKVPHAFAIGDRLVLIAEGDGNSSCFGLSERLATTSIEDLLKSLHFVEITIQATRGVGGDYCPEDSHWGYWATGSDGWNYTCQWDKFDNCSMNPYANWEREFIPGVHYTQKEKNGHTSIDTWLIDKREFHEHFMNWDITEFRGHFPSIMVDPMMKYVNAKFPNTQLTICNVDDVDHDGKPFNHAQFGPFYVQGNRTCFMCKFRVRQAKQAARRKNAALPRGSTS